MKQLKDRIELEVKNGILNYWINTAIDKSCGGFYGKISNSNVVEVNAEKGLIQNTRNLWSFSRSYNYFKDDKYLEMAKVAKDYLLNYLWDKEYGGFFWTIDSHGAVLSDTKRIYGQAFAIYALSEYFIATGDKDSLEYAKKTFELIEKYSFDKEYNGYYEALSRNWEIIDDFRLSESDMNEPKSNNTHLHIMEAYTTFAKVYNFPIAKKQLKNITYIMLNKIMDLDTLHFTLFFDMEWNKKSDIISYGHEIEASWLIYEALLVIDEKEFTDSYTKYVIDIAENCYQNYLDGKNGCNGMFNESDSKGNVDKDKIWWVQAEACVGFYLAYQLTGKEYFFKTVEKIWLFIENYIVDKEYGEWFWYGKDSGTKSVDNYKVQNWKSLYHNSRACIELLERMK